MRALVFALAAGCATAAHQLPPLDEPDDRPADQVRRYTIWLGGARVGTATEHETWSPAGVRLLRDEDLRFARGDALVAMHTSIAITADSALVPSRVAWTETGTAGAAPRRADAYRDAAGWHVTSGVAIAADAIPAELVPLYVRRDGHFAGDVFLPARGFVSGAGRVDPVAPRREIARLALSSGALAEATIDLDADGTPARVVDGEGVISRRASQDTAAAPFPAVDLVAATAIPITGEPHGARLVLDGTLALPALPGQRTEAAPDGVALVMDAALPGALPPGPRGRDRTAEIAALVATVRARITPDLGATTATPRDAEHATAGDCTTYALSYAALAGERGIPTRVVTGLRVDDDRLVRHRWAISWTGRAWIAVDAAFGAAPAGGDLVGLAVHDADDAGLVAGESALTQVRAARWAP